MNYIFIKRLGDLLISIFVISFFFVPLIILLILSIIFDKHFPLFTQNRSGINGKKIKIYKIKSMKLDKNGRLFITKIGKIIRITKLDELPQFYNILKNDMSLIGPRPLYLDFNNYYQKKHINRLKVKPGLTGLAQVNVRDSTDWKSKFDYDCYYVTNISLLLDLRIFIQTLKLLFKTIFLKKERRFESIDYKKNFMENYANK